MKFNQLHPFLLFILLVTVLLSSCSSTDCPLNNTVSLKANFYYSKTGALTNVNDTLSVIAVGRRDTTILNRYIKFNTINLPMGYAQTVDTLLFRFITNYGSVTDSVFIGHTNEPHFVSLDCSTAFFHQIKSVSCTHRNPTPNFPTAIDSILIVNPSVSYDKTENLKIFFSTY
ncbi:MAG: DUF6452 family protein [Bacteroidaceae bacterium]|nr:DUF6452 family protein [Bacteroidaceae bacterium]